MKSYCKLNESYSTQNALDASPKTKSNDNYPPTELQCGTVTGNKADRRPTFTKSKNIIILRESAADKAHISGLGEISKAFAQVSARANAKTALFSNFTSKSMRKPYKKLHGRLYCKDAAERHMHGIDGERCGIYEIISVISEA